MNPHDRLFFCRLVGLSKFQKKALTLPLPLPSPLKDAFAFFNGSEGTIS